MQVYWSKTGFVTEGMSYKTDYSNASRTQLFNIFDLKWDEEICEWFGVDIANLPEVVDSDAYFGETTFNGFFDKPIPIHSAMGDSHAALFGQACLRPGMLKATYGTGSSIMMNIGKVYQQHQRTEECCQPAQEAIIETHGAISFLRWM